MKQDHVNELLPEYLEGQLNASEERKIEEHLEKCAVCKEELQELKVLFTAFENEKELEPSASMTTAFEKMLQNEKHKDLEDGKTISINRKKRSYGLRDLLKVAAVISLVLCGYLLGKFQQAEQVSNQITESNVTEDEAGEMLALLNNTSASKRIQGVNYFENLEAPDEAIIEALIDRMLHDENSNVRLIAAEALGKFTASEEVKKNLILALKSDRDPLVQIAIIQILVKIQEKKAVAPMEQLLEQETTPAFVKEQIKSLLPSII